MNGLAPHQLEQLRELLVAERDEIARRLAENDTFGLDGAAGEATGELSLYDNHPGDAGSELFERGKDLALAEQWERELRKIENALERMASGTYGRCLACGEPIPFERLSALPSAEYCVKHVRSDAPRRRPLEEAVLRPYAVLAADGEYAADMESDETDGFADPIESFLAADLYGKGRGFVRNGAYRRYVERGEGEPY